MNQRVRPSFHAFTIKHNGKANRITTAVKLSKAFDPAQYENQEAPFPLFETTALWDTGATKSVLTQETVRALELSAVGSTNVNHAGGTSQSNTYLVNFYLPNNVGVVGVLVSECENIAGDFGAIIGMDIIAQGDFSITNVDEKTWMSYRIPSIQSIDYVKEANRITISSVGRNDPCPCGRKDASGKPVKFKYCHGKKK